MRQRTGYRTASLTLLLIGLLATQGTSVASPHTSGDSGSVSLAVLEPEQRRALEEALRDGFVLTPIAAVQSVRKFLGYPNAPVRLFEYSDATDDRGGRSYSFKVAGSAINGCAHEWEVWASATNGYVFRLTCEACRSQDAFAPPVADEADAALVAERFLHVHWADFAKRKWTRDHPWSRSDDGPFHTFYWTQLLNEVGTRAADRVSVEVRKSTGRVVSCWYPELRIPCETVPRVTLEQARTLAAPQAYRNPEEVPFSLCYPELFEYDYGLVVLVWQLYQERVDPVTGKIDRFCVTVDAQRGKCHPPFAGFLREGPSQAWRRPLREQAENLQRQLSLGQDSEVELEVHEGIVRWWGCSPVMRNGEVWLRPEILRSWGVRVYENASRMYLQYGGRKHRIEAVGGELREQSWWVPLRRVAQAFGWRITRSRFNGAYQIQEPED